MSSGEKQVEPTGCAENAAPYVLAALTEEEHEAFREHLLSCAVCREEVAALQVVADALPAVSAQLNAPPELKRRVMATVYEDASTKRVGEPARRGSLLDFLSWRPALGLAAAAVAIAVVAIVVGSGGGGGSSTRLIQAQVSAPRASAALRLSGGHAELDIAGMPQTAPNRVYEVWVKRTGAPQPTNALFTVTAKGNATVGVPGSVTGVKQILVTSEPLGGSRVPTRAPVIVASLS